MEHRGSVGSYVRSLTGRASMSCLELLETVLNGIERLSRKPIASQDLAKLATGKEQVSNGVVLENGDLRTIPTESLVRSIRGESLVERD